MEKRTAAGKAKKAAYNAEYNKTHYKRVPLDLPMSDYEKLKEAAGQQGETVNGFIKTAIKMRLSS